MMNDIRTKMGEGGRVIIPAVFRQALQLEVGDELILHIEANEIHITTPEQSLLKLQAKVKKHLEQESISLVDELIAKRRAEAKYEQ
ncbi:MAG: AbrB/MazE/SpoVT family DNA-binding domain-containing protein [Proteobacteria bacterium]|nr:AbrB/MazE/SpoVT family DNA-binding domain-containing protein [Pseudomonadota bacterium]